MDTELFAIREYLRIHNIDHTFIESLEDEGLILLVRKDDNEYVEEEQLQLLETFTRWHVELGINIEGIDALRHLLERMQEVHNELNKAKMRLRLYEAE